MLHVPEALTSAVPSTVLPSAEYRVIVSPGVPVPFRAGLALLVRPSPNTPLSLTALAVKAPVGAPGTVVSSVKSPSAVSGLIVTLPATSVVTVVTSIAPSPNANKSAAVNTTGIAAPLLVMVLVTVLVLPTKVTTEVEPTGLLTVMMPPAVAASAAVLLRSPSSVTVMAAARVSSVKSPSAVLALVVMLPAVSVVTVVTATTPWPRIIRSAPVSTTGKAVPSLMMVLVTVPALPTKVTTEVEPARLLTVVMPAAEVASAAVLLRSPSSSTVTTGALVSTVKASPFTVVLLPAVSVAVMLGV